MNRKPLVLAGLLLLAAAPAAAQIDAFATPDDCVAGWKQSPIRLEPPLLPDTEPPRVSYGVIQNAYAFNTGLTVQVNVPEPAPRLWLGGTEYKLLEFHFHHPQEHQIGNESRGQVEVHLVHSSEGHGEAVIATFVNATGQSNGDWTTLLDRLPTAGDTVRDLRLDLNAMFNLGDLAQERIYRYDGSLTTPPFCEGVTFLVRDRPITWSQAQYSQLTARTPQLRRLLMPRHGRPIYRRN